MLVTNSSYSLESMAQLYRDRGDAENGFDELKKQWGWGGFTTQEIERCQTIPRRALLLAGVGKATQHAGQTTLYLPPLHAAKTTIVLLISNIRAALSYARKVAEQSAAADRWKTLLDYIVARIVLRRPRKRLDISALLLGDCRFLG